MTNKRYQSGRNFEYRVKRYFETQGYFVVRSAGSKGIADLIAISPDGTVSLVQCKLYGTISVKEYEELRETALKFKALPVIAFKNENNKLCTKEIK